MKKFKLSNNQNGILFIAITKSNTELPILLLHFKDEALCLKLAEELNIYFRINETKKTSMLNFDYADQETEYECKTNEIALIGNLDQALECLQDWGFFKTDKEIFTAMKNLVSATKVSKLPIFANDSDTESTESTSSEDEHERLIPKQTNALSTHSFFHQTHTKSMQTNSSWMNKFTAIFK